MAEPFPTEELKKVLRWIIEWAQEPEGAVSGQIQIHIIKPEKKPKDEFDPITGQRIDPPETLDNG